MRIQDKSERNARSSPMNAVQLSLTDLLGESYAKAVAESHAFLSTGGSDAAMAQLRNRVELFPHSFQTACDSLLDHVGLRVVDALDKSTSGAATGSFERATNIAASPLSSLGFYRVGEDGRLYLTTKSEHYHTSLGHGFPGYALVDMARKLGISNSTHNNTRGYITRTLERELVRTVNGIPVGDESALEATLSSRADHKLNRCINLQTGSLAVEAAVKMMLTRFYRLDPDAPAPKYQGRIPVFLVIGDSNGGSAANYHGTTVLTQLMRGLWPDLSQSLEDSQILLQKTVEINNSQSFRSHVKHYDSGKYKIAGFLHEIILMNYGATKLEPSFLQEVYSLCDLHDIPTVADEIQSCMWSPELYLFREYGVNPDFVAIGKGFPGGNVSASKVLTTYPMDSLSQFGALVTNGQEELSSLYYLVTMRFVQENRAAIEEVGSHYQKRLDDLVGKHPGVLTKREGLRHMSSLFFVSKEKLEKFVHAMISSCIDISGQAYKPNSPPAALTKLPLISTHRMVEYLVSKMDRVIESL